MLLRLLRRGSGAGALLLAGAALAVSFDHQEDGLLTYVALYGLAAFLVGVVVATTVAIERRGQALVEARLAEGTALLQKLRSVDPNFIFLLERNVEAWAQATQESLRAHADLLAEFATAVSRTADQTREDSQRARSQLAAAVEAGTSSLNKFLRAPLRIWIDITASAHVLVFRPVVDILRERGHHVTITARDYGQTLELLEMHDMEYVPFGRHGGSSRMRKGLALAGRTAALARFARRGRFDLALAHGSNDLALAAALLRIPAANTFDYEFALLQHNIGCRLARRVVVPDRIPPERLRRFGAGPRKIVQYPGLKEEYYLADFQPDPTVLDRLGIDRQRVVVVFRPPPEVSMYHRDNPFFAVLLERLGGDDGAHVVVIPRIDAQRDAIRAMDLPSVIVPDGAVDAQSLIALADLVVSAGGTMNREAVALGTPVYTIFRGRLGGVDEALIREGRLLPLDDPGAVLLQKKHERGGMDRRDPNLLVDVFLGTPR